MEAGESGEPSSETKPLKPGVRGGLLLLVLWLGIIDPIYSMALNGFVAVRWQQAYPQFAAYYASWGFWGFIVLREGMRIMAALVLLLRRRPDAVWFTLAIVWLSGPLLVLGSWMMFGDQVMPGALIRSMAVAIAATIYLLRSERVRNTYGFGETNAETRSA
jgi:hypothetical protein